VRYVPGAKTLLGAKSYNRPPDSNTLYGNYQAFTRDFGEVALKPYAFLEQLTSYLATMGYKDVSSKRITNGIVVLNIVLAVNADEKALGQAEGKIQVEQEDVQAKTVASREKEEATTALALQDENEDY
jgi:hypothetical protein